LEDRLTPAAGNIVGGATVAAGDVTGDGYSDLVVSLAGRGSPTVEVIDGRTGQVAWQFLAYSPDFTGGVSVAIGDVTGDGHADIITGAGAGGGPNVKVFDGVTRQEVRSFFAFVPHFTGGARVAAGDVNGDKRADIAVAAGFGGGPVVAVFDGATGAPLATIVNGDPSSAVGATVAMGDLTGDGRADLVVGSGGGIPVVRVYDLTHGTDFVGQFPPYDSGFSGPVWVAVGDVTGDGRPDVVTGAGTGGGSNTRVFDGLTFTLIQSWMAYTPDFRGGVLVTTADFDGDGRAEVVTGAGAGGGPNVRLFDGETAELRNSISCDGGDVVPLALAPPPPTVSVPITAPIAGTLPPDDGSVVTPAEVPDRGTEVAAIELKDSGVAAVEVKDNGAGIAAVEVSVNDSAFAPATVQEDGTYSIRLTDLQPGLNTVVYRATDLNGNRSPVTVQTVLYKPAPKPVSTAVV